MRRESSLTSIRARPPVFEFINTLTPLRLFNNVVRGNEAINWGAIGSLAFEPFEDHVISATYVFNVATDKTATAATGGFSENVGEGRELNSFSLIWNERLLEMLQFRGEHRLQDVLGMKLDWLVSIAQTSQEEPDARYLNYVFDVASGRPQFLNDYSPNRPVRYYRDLGEDNLNFKVDDSVPFPLWRGLEGMAKAGYFFSESLRNYNERTLDYETTDLGDGFFETGDPNLFLTQGNFTNLPPRAASSVPANFAYDGESRIEAAYFMLDLPVWDRLRLIGGLRIEDTFIEVDTVNQNTGDVFAPGLIDQRDYLPAVSMIYTIITNLNLRASWAETIARPTFREISPAVLEDVVTSERLQGNPNLKISNIENYDMRLEWFPRPGEVVSVGAFYKTIQNPIEKVYLTLDGQTISYQNTDNPATVWGLEFEARRRLDFIDPLLENFTVGFNYSYIVSEIARPPSETANRPDVGSERTLFDQSPYIVNADVTWEHPRWGTTATIAYNVSGPRLAVVGIIAADVIEQPAPQLDIILSQKIGKHWRFRVTAKNILNPLNEQIYDTSDALGNRFVYQSFRRGISIGCSLTYSY
ncbi:MAG: TonB-dependent receptor [Verrucomicrobiae bacterium]|nr:TonB-dependent receptor [Verrucomicrobiae bacterium]